MQGSARRLRSWTVWLALVIALLALTGLPAGAQGDFSPDEQAALDSARAALQQIASAQTLSAEIDQTSTQSMTVTLMGQTVQLDQTITSAGTTLIERRPSAAFDNMDTTLISTVEQHIIAPGQDETSTIGPMTTAVIALDDRVYMRVEAPDEIAALLPSGWKDVTEDASAFAGMGVVDVTQLLAMSRDFLNLTDPGLFETVLAVDLPADHDGVITLHLDPASLLDLMDENELAGVFGAGEMPFDTAGVFNAIFAAESTHYTLDVVLGPEGELQSIATHLVIDTVIPSDLITDPTLTGAELTLVQDAAEQTTFLDLDGPVTITAPVIE